MEKNAGVCLEVSQGASKGMEGASYSRRLVLEHGMADIEGRRRRLLVRGEHVDDATVSGVWWVLCRNLNQ